MQTIHTHSSEAAEAVTSTTSNSGNGPIDKNKDAVGASTLISQLPSDGNKSVEPTTKMTKPTTKAKAGDAPKLPADEVEEQPAEEKLTAAQIEALKQCENDIETSRREESDYFAKRATALHKIHADKLYRETHTAFERYVAEKWKFQRAHAHRHVFAGEILARYAMSPRGDSILESFKSEAYFRPLAKMEPDAQDHVLDLLAKWAEWAPESPITPQTVHAAKRFLSPAVAPNVEDQENPLVEKLKGVVDAAKAKLPSTAGKDIRQLFDQIKKKATALGNPKRLSGIDWTDATWNPLHGCTWVSTGCDNCYAAELVATRLAHLFPGLAKEMMKDGKKTYVFTGKILLNPEALAIPLSDKTPRRYFVNSMSDLFHKNVKDKFIEAVFAVMEKATWHEFQITTKRPERMAKFTASYYKDRTPPPNIWLGTSVENQETLDKRLPELLKVKAAVRWISAEPLLGPLKFESLDGIHWVVVGGESGSTRKMDAEWATSIRDACEKEDVPFFFKQWGEYGEDGEKLKKKRKDGLTPPAIDGVIHNAYPTAQLELQEAEGEKTQDAPTKKDPAKPADTKPVKVKSKNSNKEGVAI